MRHKVVSINTRKFLGDYCEAQNSERIPEEALFFTGIILTVVLPQIIYCAYGGPIPRIVFAAGALTGALYGVAMYHRLPSRIISYFSRRTMPQAMHDEIITLKKAA